MGKGRLAAFSDGVLSIVITIMVLKLKVPHGSDIHALTPLAPVFLGYVLSFLYVGIYWTNHHHLLHTVKRVTGGVLWANLHLLFWLSLFPVVTAWAGDYPTANFPSALYGVVLLAAAAAWIILQRAIIAAGGTLREALGGSDFKSRASPVVYLIGIFASFSRPWIAQLLYAIVATMWIVPDRRIERHVAKK